MLFTDQPIALRGTVGAHKNEPSAKDLPQIIRPYQYMGAKLRALDAIVDVALEVAPRGGRAIDLFTGSSVVAQAFARAGFLVDAYDALTFCATSAGAILGCERCDGETLSSYAAQFASAVDLAISQTAFAKWLTDESKALADRDGARLLSIGATLPQIWRPSSASTAIHELFSRVHDGQHQSQKSPPIATTFYAGSYFGIRQAIEIDALRNAIEVLALSRWQRDAALCCLTTAMSLAAFTPGKHFAQPHKIDQAKDLSFHQERALADRSISVLGVFLDTCAKLDELPYRHAHGHRALQSQLENLQPNAVPTDVAVVYADPPYTAQQYSRFYHVPESITTGRVPRLQIHRGHITSGLYPADRFKSRFCSKTDSCRAFRDLFAFTKDLNVPIVISYAQSGSGKSGNERMVSLDFLTATLKSSGFRDIAVRTLHHAYRQMNHSRRAVIGRDDQELLITGVPSC
jgi:adenine-specific DNA-methyltransferase